VPRSCCEEPKQIEYFHVDCSESNGQRTHASSRLAAAVQHQPYNSSGVSVVCKKNINKANLDSDASRMSNRAD
jgi:hypothetical protein